MTEDGEFFDKFQHSFGNQVLYVEQERVYYNSKEERKDLLFNVIKMKDSIDFGVRYLASLYIMSQCQGLLANGPVGAYLVAESWNGGKYEFNQVIID